MGESDLIDYYQSQGIELFNAGAKSRLCDKHKSKPFAPTVARDVAIAAGTPEMSAVWPQSAPSAAYTTPNAPIAGALAKMSTETPVPGAEKPKKVKEGLACKRDYQPAKYQMGYLHITLAWM